MKPILLIDNYDSFTYNLVQYLEESGCRVQVVKNTALNEIQIDEYLGVVISPGPGLPATSGQLMSFLREHIEEIPTLGVCLGLQAIAVQYGWRLINLEQVFHGVATELFLVAESSLFDEIRTGEVVGRYHSWAVMNHRDNEFQERLAITALSRDGTIMALEHPSLPIYGVQFHPESILTPTGRQLIMNFVKICQAEEGGYTENNISA